MQAMIVSLIINSLKGVLFTFLSEKVIKSLIMALLEKFTEWTDTDVDDTILAMAKENKNPLPFVTVQNAKAAKTSEAYDDRGDH